MKKLFILLPILLITACTGNDIDPQNYYDLRENNFIILGKTVDLEELVNEAKQARKLILFYFNGRGCTNCRHIEERVLGDREIAKTIIGNFLLVPLTLDDFTKIPEDERERSAFSGKMMKNVGSVNVDLSNKICKCSSQPNFVIMNSEEEILGKIGYTNDKKEYLHFLKSSIRKQRWSFLPVNLD